MTQHHTALPNPESEPEVSQWKSLSKSDGNQNARASASRFSPTYWASRVARRSYVHNGERCEVGEYHAQIQHAGERRRVNLGTNSREAAARVAARAFKAISAKGWEEGLAEILPGQSARVRTDVLTVGEYIAQASMVAQVRPQTLHGYVTSLRWFVAQAFRVADSPAKFDHRTGGRAAWVERIDRVRLDRLTPQLIESAVARHVGQFKGNPLLESRARRSTASLLRQARSLFSPGVTKRLPMKVDCNPFSGVMVESARPQRYVSSINAGQLLRDARAELADADPEAYKALLLGLGAGLRKREIDLLQWPQIDRDKLVIRIQTTDVFQPKTDDSEGAVFVDSGLIAELERYRPRATGLFVLESHRQAKPQGTLYYYRCAPAFDRLSAWLRGKGVLSAKPLHALRKEFGSIVAASADVFTASRQLRHSSIEVTAAYYLDNRKRVAPAIGDALGIAPMRTTSIEQGITHANGISIKLNNPKS